MTNDIEHYTDLPKQRIDVARNLFVHIGVYGWWIGVYGTELDRNDEAVLRIERAYLAAVKSKEWLQFMYAIDEYCRESGCETAEQCARRIGTWK